jgi:hypothetical protein
MSIGFGTCPYCSTQNHVFRSVEETMSRDADTQPRREETNSFVYVILWECFRCEQHFKTTICLHGPAVETTRFRPETVSCHPRSRLRASA